MILGLCIPFFQAFLVPPGSPPHRLSRKPLLRRLPNKDRRPFHRAVVVAVMAAFRRAGLALHRCRRSSVVRFQPPCRKGPRLARHEAIISVMGAPERQLQAQRRPRQVRCSPPSIGRTRISLAAQPDLAISPPIRMSRAARQGWARSTFPVFSIVALRQHLRLPLARSRAQVGAPQRELRT